MQIVYAITCGLDGPTKIGRAGNLKRRLEALQNGSWQDLRVGYFGAFYRKTDRGAALGLGECFATSSPAARALEKATHKTLKSMDLWIRGEWFDINAKDAGLVVEKVARQVGLTPMVGDEFRKYIDLYGPSADGNKSAYRELRAFVSSLEFGENQMRQFLTEFKDAA